MDGLGKEIIDVVKKILKKSNLDIFSILFTIDIFGYFGMDSYKKLLHKNHLIQIIIKSFRHIFSNEIITEVFGIAVVLIGIICLIELFRIDIPSQILLNGSVTEYNYSTAFSNIFYYIYCYAYNLNIIYITIQIWFEKLHNIFKLPNLETLLIIIDLLILTYKLICSIFLYTYKIEFKEVIDNDNFDANYFIISSKKIGDHTEIMILKDRIMNNHAFYVVKREKTNNEYGSQNKYFYEILDSSLNFEEIKYSYEFQSKKSQEK